MKPSEIHKSKGFIHRVVPSIFFLILKAKDPRRFGAQNILEAFRRVHFEINNDAGLKVSSQFAYFG